MERLFDEEPAGRGETSEPAGGAPGPGPDAPLAARLRPRTLDEIVGQRALLGPGALWAGSSLPK